MNFFRKLVIHGDKLKYRNVTIANVLWFLEDDKSLSRDIVPNFPNVTLVELKEKIVYGHIGGMKR